MIFLVQDQLSAYDVSKQMFTEIFDWRLHIENSKDNKEHDVDTAEYSDTAWRLASDIQF